MDKKEAAATYNEASRLFEKGHYSGALQRLVMLERAFPDTFNIQFSLLRCREKLGQHSEARDLCRQMARRFPRAREQRRLSEAWKRLAPPRSGTSVHNRGAAADDAGQPGKKDSEYTAALTDDSPWSGKTTDEDPIDIDAHKLKPGEIVAYVLCVLSIALLGVDRFFLYALFCFDICVYLLSRPVKLTLHRHSNGVKWVTICFVTLAPAISATGCAAVYFGVTSLAGQRPGEIVLGALVLLAAATGVVQEHISNFRKTELRFVSFLVHIRNTHKLDGKPFFTGGSTCMGCVVEGYGMLFLYTLIALLALGVAGMSIDGDMAGHREEIVAASILGAVKLVTSVLYAAAVHSFYGKNSTPEEKKKLLLKTMGVNPEIVRRTTAAQPAKDQQPPG